MVLHFCIPIFQVLHHTLSSCNSLHNVVWGRAVLHMWFLFQRAPPRKLTCDGKHSIVFYLFCEAFIDCHYYLIVMSICSFFSLRFLDTAGLKKSSAYLVNGILMFLAWLVSEMLVYAIFLTEKSNFPLNKPCFHHLALGITIFKFRNVLSFHLSLL
jgi:hypothetical protein